MEVGESLVINSSSLSPLRKHQDSTVGSSFKMQQLSRASKQQTVSFAVLDYIYRVRRKHCYNAKNSN